MTDGELEAVRCNLCGSDDTRVVYDLPPHQIVRCRVCGLVYTNPRSTIKAISHDLYDADYWSRYEPAVQAVRRFARTWLRRIRPFLGPAPWRICELGPGLGVFLSEAKDAGHSVSGIELSRYAIDFARERFGIDTIVQGTLETLDAESIPPVDLFVMIATIEHLQDPLGALRFARTRLRPGGVLFLSTGVWGSFNQRVAGTRWGIIAPKGHLYYFSKRTMRAMLQKAGFEVASLRTNGFLVNPLTDSRWLVRLFNNPLTKVLRLRLVAERLGLGDEMFVIARAA